MQITAAKTALKDALSRLMGVVEGRTTIPILANIRLSAAGKDGLTITATDMDIEASELLEVKVSEQGVTTVPGKTFAAIIGKVDAEFVDFAAAEHAARLTAGKSKFNLGTLPAEEFPKFGDDDEKATIEIESESLRRLIDRVKGAQSAEETRYYLNGIYLEKFGNGVRAVATDGHRLLRAEETADVKGEWPGIIIPRKAVTEIRKLVDKPQGKVIIRIGTNKAVVIAGNTTLKTKLIDGTYPDYDRVIPKETTLEASLTSEHLRDAVDRVATVSNEKSNAVRFTFTPNILTIAANDTSGSSATDEIAAAYSGEKVFEIGFNAAYITQALAFMPGEVRMHMTDPASPVRLEDPADPTYLGVIMPMRV